MKDQYFGDINDYRKYGLLRCLTEGGALSTLVCWMLTPSDGGGDGGFVQYLETPQKARLPAFHTPARAKLTIAHMVNYVLTT